MSDLFTHPVIWLSTFTAYLIFIEIVNYSVLRSIESRAAIFWWTALSICAFTLLLTCPIGEPFARLGLFLVMGPSLQNSFDISFRKSKIPFQARTLWEYLRWACSPPDTQLHTSEEEKQRNRILGRRRLISGLKQFGPGIALVITQIYYGFFGQHVALFWSYVVGITLLLPSGTFRMCIGMYMAFTGAYAKPMFDNPVGSTSISEFWNRRWNLMFARNALRNIFIPLYRKGVNPSKSTIAVFLASGLIHEILLMILNNRPNGYNLAFFLLQGVAVNIERKYQNRLRRHPVVGRLITWTWFAATSPLFFDGFFEAFPILFQKVW
jgi:hypothetical protein